MKFAISILLACVLILANFQAHAEVTMPPIKNRHLLSVENDGKYTTSASDEEGTSGDLDNNHRVFNSAERPKPKRN